MAEKIDAKKFEQWLNRRWKTSVNCPICNSFDWTYGDRLYELREYQGEKVMQRAVNVYPLVTVTCNQCGYTRFFNAIIAGHMKPE
jgi:predicted nucleic-acid-binding Zn-ribbon protein